VNTGVNECSLYIYLHTHIYIHIYIYIYIYIYIENKRTYDHSGLATVVTSGMHTKSMERSDKKTVRHSIPSRPILKYLYIAYV